MAMAATTFNLTTSYQDVSASGSTIRVIIYKLREGDSGTVRIAASGSPAHYWTMTEDDPFTVEIPENASTPPTVYMRMETGTATLERLTLT